MIEDEEHSWRQISLGGNASVTVAISGNLMSADPSCRAWLMRLFALVDEDWSGDAAAPTEES